jgi:DNA-binding NtrC family response regulator
MESSWDILVASADSEMRDSIVATLRHLGAEPICASTVSECRKVLAKQDVGLVFCDRQFADGSYRDLMAFVNSGPRKAWTRVILATSFVGPGEYHEAKRCGMFEVIASPSDSAGHTTAIEWMVILAQRDDLKRRDLASPYRQSVSGLPGIAAAAAKA